MNAKVTKITLKVLAYLALVGGLVHVLNPLGFDVLAKIQSWTGYSSFIQFVAGVATIVVVWLGLKK